MKKDPLRKSVSVVLSPLLLLSIAVAGGSVRPNHRSDTNGSLVLPVATPGHEATSEDVDALMRGMVLRLSAHTKSL